MLKYRSLSLIIMTFTGLSILGSQTALAQNGSHWQPQLSEKILMLPPKHLNEVIEKDFVKSGLANHMNNIESEISEQVSMINELASAIDNYENAERIEARHQVIVGKKNYIELLGEQNLLKQQRIKTKLNLLTNLEKAVTRNAHKTENQSDISELQNELKSRSIEVSAKLNQEISLETLQDESKFSKAFNKKITAIAALKDAIASHRMQSHSGIDADLSKKEIIREMKLNTEAELALVDIENELLGHMAHLLSLDAMALAEDSASQSFDVATNVMNFSTASDAVSLFIQ